MHQANMNLATHAHVSRPLDLCLDACIHDNSWRNDVQAAYNEFWTTIATTVTQFHPGKLKAYRNEFWIRE